jgi:flagellar biosynthesis protein FlhA
MLSETARRQESLGRPAALLVSPVLRPWFARFVRHTISTLRVLAYNEVPDNKRIQVVATIGR